MIKRVRCRMTTRDHKLLTVWSPRDVVDAEFLLRIRMRPEFAIVCAIGVDNADLSAAAHVRNCANTRWEIFLRARIRSKVRE
jgi:hypothetical protein